MYRQYYLLLERKRHIMKRTFLETHIFSKRWGELGFNDTDLLKLQTFVETTDISLEKSERWRYNTRYRRVDEIALCFAEHREKRWGSGAFRRFYKIGRAHV